MIIHILFLPENMKTCTKKQNVVQFTILYLLINILAGFFKKNRDDQNSYCTKVFVLQIKHVEYYA